MGPPLVNPATVEDGIGDCGKTEFLSVLVADFSSTVDGMFFTPDAMEAVVVGVSLLLRRSSGVAVAIVVAIFIPGGGVMLGLSVVGKPLVVMTLEALGGAALILVAGA